MLHVLIAAVLLLAYSNGANDNFKGVARLYGSGTTGYRRALAWATVTTLAGSLLALLLVHGMVDAFKGKGLVLGWQTGRLLDGVRRGRVRPRPQRHAEDRRPAAGCAGAGAQPGAGRGGRRDGDRRPAQCASRRRHDEPSHRHHDSRPA